MIKRISSLTMCVLFLYQSICQAVPMQTFNLGLGLPYVFLPNEPQIIANPLIFTIKAVCTITS